MNNNAATDPTRQEPPASAGAAPRRGEPSRVQYLFRVMTRLGLVHPLQHLIQRYRAGDQA